MITRKSCLIAGIGLLLLAMVLPVAAQTPPVALPDIYSTALDTPLTLIPDLLANDSPTASLVLFNQPANGSVINSADVLTYTPNTGFIGLDTFTYTITDGPTNTLGKAFIEVGSPNIDLFQIAYGDMISNGVPGTGAGNIEVVGAQDVYLFQGVQGQEAIFDSVIGNNGLTNWRLDAPDGTVLFDSFNVDRRVTLPVTGTYTFTIRGFQAGNTGVYSFGLYLVPPPQEFAISIGDVISNGVPAPGAGNLEVPGAADIYTLDGVAGQSLIIDILAGNTGLARVTLFAPDGTQVLNNFLVDQQGVLPQTGTYTLSFTGVTFTNTGTYSFQLLNVATSQEFAISIGDTVSDGIPEPGAGNIETPGAMDIYTFDGLATETIIFDKLVGNNGQFRVVLTAPDGTEVFSDFFIDQQVSLPQTGTYSLQIAGNGITNVGVYSFQLLSVPPDSQEFTISIGDTVSDGVPEPGAGNLEVPGAVDIYTFDGLVTETIIFDKLVGNNGQFGVVLTAPDGTEVFSDFFVDRQVTLPQTGTYRLRIAGSSVTNFGVYSFQLLSVPPASQEFAISIGDTVLDGVPEPGAGNIEVPGAVDIYHFDATGGQNITFDALVGSNGQFRVILAAPDGTEIFNGFFIDQTVALPQTGTYDLTIQGLLVTNFGTYSFALVEITNSSPVAVDDTAITDEDVPVIIAMLTNDSDVDGDTLVVDSSTQPTNGSAVVNADNTVTYTPNADFNGSDSFTYTASDGNGGTATATVNITITPVNDAPLAIDDSAITDEDVPVIIAVLTNDSDVDGDTLVVDSSTQLTNGSTVVNADNTVTYTPNTDFNGSDNFTYTVSDGNGGTVAATVNITINPVNDAPIAVDDSATTAEDVPVTVTVLANDSDVDGDALVIDSITQPTNGSTVVNVDNTVTYTSNVDFNGTDSFTYTASDGNGGTATATVNVTINPVNDAPVAVDDSATTDEDTPVNISVLSNDSDVDDDTLSITDVTQPTNGSTEINLDNTVTYTPNVDFNGADSFTYTASDGNGGTAMATVTITVIAAVNQAPVALDNSAVTNEDTPVTIAVLANDTDPDGDTLVVDSITQPTNGNTAINLDNTVTYTPNVDFNGSDSFTYTVYDGNGGMATATVNITITPVNDAPIAVDDSATTDEDTPINVEVLANDSDVDGDTLVVDSSTQPTNGNVTINPDNTITYTPNTDFNGADSFTYTASDGNGGTATATVNITITPVNDAPVAVDDSAITNEDVPVTVTVLANDSDVDGDTLVVDSITQPSNGGVVVNADNTVTYTPNADFNGADSFTYTASDGNGGTATATVTIIVIAAANQAPIATVDAYNVAEDTVLTVIATDGVLSNDNDADGDTLSVSLITTTTNGSLMLNADGSFEYQPSLNFNGIDVFEYLVSDGRGGTDSATVTLTITPVNDDPMAVDDSASTNENTPVNIEVLANDGDVDGDALVVDSITQPTSGSAAINLDNTILYTPNTGFIGSDDFTYTASDGNGGMAVATVTVRVNSATFQTVRIDVLPFIWLNVVNLNSKGILPVAILSDSSFDARFVNVDTVEFAGAPAVEPRRFWPKFTQIDVNFDRRKDIIVYFNIQDLQLDPDATEATLTGETFSGTAFQGTDRVYVIPPRAPFVVRPEDGEIVRTNRPLFQWYPVAFVTCYQIQINDAPFTADEQSALQEQTIVISSHYFAAPLPDGVYYWRVRVGGNCDLDSGPWSSVNRFTIQRR